MNKTKLLLVDDHPLFLDGLSMLLDLQDGIEIVATAKDGAEALEVMENNSIEIVISDLSMPVKGGIQFIQEAANIYPDVKFIALTMLNDLSSVSDALEAGANGYLLKNTNATELSKAIESVKQGDSYLSVEIATLLAKRWQNRGASPLENLTQREKEVLQHVVKGESSKTIAGQLSVSLDTIKFHRKNILSKLNQPNVAALVSFAKENGF